MKAHDLERYRALTRQYPSFVGLTYLPFALFLAGLAFVNPHASGPLTFFGFWAVVLPLLVLAWRAIVRGYRDRFGSVRPLADQRRRARLATGILTVVALALFVLDGVYRWDETLGIETAHLIFAVFLISLWGTGFFAASRLHLPLCAVALAALAFLDHDLLVVGSWDLVPDVEEGSALVDAAVLAAMSYLDHRWLVREMKALHSADGGGGELEVDHRPAEAGR